MPFTLTPPGVLDLHLLLQINICDLTLSTKLEYSWVHLTTKDAIQTFNVFNQMLYYHLISHNLNVNKTLCIIDH